MKVILMGGERIGTNLAKRLAKTGNETVIVELDKERTHKLTSELDALVVHGGGTDIDVLRDTGVENADALVALTPNDESNLLACKLAKNLDVLRMVVRANESKHAVMFEDVGADVVISSITTTVGLYEKAVTDPEIYGLLSLGGEKADAVEITVGEGSEAGGKSIEELKLPELYTIATTTRKNELVQSREEAVLEEGDRVILAGEPDQVISSGKLSTNRKKLRIPLWRVS